MKISEIFYSLQGEGALAGVPSVFIRLAGCPLRCRWCDTKYAWEESAGTEYSIKEIVDVAGQWKSKYVVITGGEPMIADELSKLCKALESSAEHITIETAGIAYVPDLSCNLMSISPKLSNSLPADAKLTALHDDSLLDSAVLKELIDHYEYQLKFVVDRADDIDEINETLADIDPVKTDKVFLMPQAANRSEYIEKSPMVAELCKQTGFSFSPRLQILLWDNQRGT